MFKTINPDDHPCTITVTAQAVWNPEKGIWEVDILQNETRYSALGDHYDFVQSVHHVEVEDCDEYVIADALLEANGINVQSLYNSPDNPIVKSE